MSLDVWNTCERCESKRSAPEEAIACDFELGGFKRRYYICEACRNWMTGLIEDAMRKNNKQ